MGNGKEFCIFEGNNDNELTCPITSNPSLIMKEQPLEWFHFQVWFADLVRLVSCHWWDSIGEMKLKGHAFGTAQCEALTWNREARHSIKLISN